MSHARLVTVILVSDTIGEGREKSDPIQPRVQLFTKTGKLLAQKVALGDQNLVHDGDGWHELENEP